MPHISEAPRDGLRLKVQECVPLVIAGSEIAWHITEVVRALEAGCIEHA
jgi:hypothetical protein